MSVRVSYTKQWMFGIMFILLILSIVEISARTYEYSQPACSFLDSKIFKNLELSQKESICNDSKAMHMVNEDHLFPEPNQHLDTININSHGFRGPEISEEKPTNVYRIFVVGGSTILGYGSTSDNTTIPGYLQQNFNSLEVDVTFEVINSGMSAANSFEEAHKIKNFLLDYQPDLIVVYDGWNDSIKKPVEGEWRPRTVFHYEDKDDLYKFFVSNSNLYRTPFVLYDPLYQPIQANSLDEKTIQNISKIWKDRWVNVCEINNQVGVSTVIALQPIVGTSDRELSSNEKMHAEWIKQVKSRQILQELALTLGEINETCDATIDLRNAFDGINDPVYWDAGHMGDFGNKIISKKIFDSILPIVEKNIS